MDYDWKFHDDLCGSDHFPVLLNNIGPDVDEPVSRWKLNKANWAQFQTLSTTRLLEDTVRKADDPIESFASILINIAEETVPKTVTKSKKAKKPWFTEDCKTAIKQRKGALRQFNNRPTHDNLDNYRIFRAKISNNKKKRNLKFSSDNSETYNQPFSLSGLKDALSKAHDSSPGPDDIHYQFLKHLPDTSLSVLLKTFNDIWETGNVPKSWKQATIIPILKPGKDNTNPNNYRPIALTSCICKTLERMINERPVWYLEVSE